jgi:hypothetical protein
MLYEGLSRRVHDHIVPLEQSGQPSVTFAQVIDPRGRVDEDQGSLGRTPAGDRLQLGLTAPEAGQAARTLALD